MLRLSTGIAAAESERAICHAMVDGLHDSALGCDLVAVLLVKSNRHHACGTDDFKVLRVAAHQTGIVIGREWLLTNGVQRVLQNGVHNEAALLSAMRSHTVG